jgi:hypothetical protein
MNLQDDRRGTAGQRVAFEALVVVEGDKSGAGAYECEAVDVSEHGMHLRTAYLPDLGQPLVFRFDGGTGEIVAEGSVLWRDEQAKGGEFGVRFTKMTPESLTALREICGISEGGEPEAQAAPAAASAQKGSRVRLHIEGLGSPMRARVRDAHTGEVMVGSNLEFLKVGRSIDLEDVEGGKKRAAIIDKVEVEVDPQSKIPQLVVSLRYDDVPMTAKEGSAKAPAPKAEAKAAAASSDTDSDADGDHEEEPHGPTLADRARNVAAVVGPRLSAVGATLGATFTSLVAKARASRAAGETDDEDRPRRKTAPPPDGALHASGTKVVRGEKGEPMDEETLIEEPSDASREKQKRRTKILAASGGAFLVTLMIIFGLRARSAPPGEGTAPVADANAPALPMPGAAPKPLAPAGSGEAVAANIPLFGTTPLSTTEPAPLPPDPKLAAAPTAPMGEDEPKSDKPASTTFGKGKVVHAKTVRLKMDAPITDVRGSVDGSTITLSMPGRRNVESASTFAKKDKRIASAKAVPKDGGVDVTLTFKDSVPAFLAKANGKMLEIELGESKGASAGEDDGAEAKGGKKHKKNKATAKKGGEKKHKKAKKSDD